MSTTPISLCRTLRRLWSGKAVLALPGIAATLILLVLHIAELPALRQLGNLSFDTYARSYPRAYAPAPVKVVDIDDETLRRLGRSPWPRTDVARLTRLLTEIGASAIAFDIALDDAGMAELGFARLVTRYRMRIAAYRATLPPTDWDGIYRATER